MVYSSQIFIVIVTLFFPIESLNHLVGEQYLVDGLTAGWDLEEK